uniref:Glycosyltransferase RgtA/B/C/D-like domain-containing protein n=1 Tax=candidate division WOR-3 bacterium TaxID=2052148 RepID=A0A7V4E4Q5_UNCW3
MNESKGKGNLIKKFGKFKEILGNEKLKWYLSITLSTIVAIFTTYMVILHRGLSFDGAFHTQAAINLYKGASFNLDYGIKPYIQIGLPFQIFNGLFIYLFGRNFVVANLANILFYWLFFGFILFLSRKYSSVLPLLSFIAISFMPAFQIYGFGGYGELPALMYAIFGVYVLLKGLVKEDNSLLYIVFGFLMLSFAVATKWIIYTLFIPLSLLCIPIALLLRKYSQILLGSIVFALNFIVLFLIQYYEPANPQIVGILFNALYNQATQNPYNSYLLRLSAFMEEYIRYSGFEVMAWLKIVLAVFIGILAAIDYFKIIKSLYIKVKNKNRTEDFDERRLFLIFICLSSVFYLFCWFFLWQKNWYRRVFNADILLFLSIGLLSNLYNKNSKNNIYRILKSFSVLAIVIFIIFYGYIQLSHLNLDNTSGKLESKLKEGLSSLPENFEGFGYGWWQAPRWSYISGKKFHNLFEYPVLYYTLQGIPCYVFYEPENVLDLSSIKYIEDTYNIRTVFEYKGFKIVRIIDFNKTNVIYTEEIDFSKGDFSKSIKNFWRWERGFRHSKIESAIFLNNTGNFSYIYMDFKAHKGLENVILKGFLIPANESQGYIYDIPVRVVEHNHVFLEIPLHQGNKLLTLYLFHLGEIKKPPNDARLLGITVWKIKLTNLTDKSDDLIIKPSGVLFVEPISK